MARCLVSMDQAIGPQKAQAKHRNGPALTPAATGGGAWRVATGGLIAGCIGLLLRPIAA